MASDALYQALAEALSQPSRSYRTFQEGVGALDKIGEGYQKGLDIEDKLRKRKLQQQTLLEALGGQVPSRLQPFSNLTTEQVGPWDSLLKYGFEKEEDDSPVSVISDVDALKMGKVPKGAKIVASGNIGPAAKKRESEEKAEAEAKQGVQESSIRKADIAIGKVDSALSKVGRFTAGAGGAVMGVLPGSTARDLQRDLDTIEALVSFDALAEMRKNSPTGGALGQIALRELDLLGATIASLKRDQSPPALVQNLNAVKTHFQNWKEAVQRSEMVGSAPGVTRNLDKPNDPALHATATNAQGVQIETNDGGKTWRPVKRGN